MPRPRERNDAERKKKADVTNEGNHTPASEPIEQDLFELEVRDADIYSVSETLDSSTTDTICEESKKNFR